MTLAVIKGLRMVRRAESTSQRAPEGPVRDGFFAEYRCEVCGQPVADPARAVCVWEGNLHEAAAFVVHRGSCEDGISEAAAMERPLSRGFDEVLETLSAPRGAAQEDAAGREDAT